MFSFFFYFTFLVGFFLLVFPFMLLGFFSCLFVYAPVGLVSMKLCLAT